MFSYRLVTIIYEKFLLLCNLVTMEVALKSVRYTYLLWRSLLIMVVMILTACTSSNPDVVSTPTAMSIPTVLAYPGAYPLPPPPTANSNDPYPLPSYRDLPEGPRFTIDQPVRLSSGRITGSGPAGVPIRIVNITRGAIDIATTTIGADGTFNAPLVDTFVGDRVAIMLGDLTGTSFDRNQFLRGPSYEDWPLIGILFASAIVEE